MDGVGVELSDGYFVHTNAEHLCSQFRDRRGRVLEYALMSTIGKINLQHEVKFQDKSLEVFTTRTNGSLPSKKSILS